MRRRSIVIAALTAAVVVAGALVWWFVIRDDAPAEVDIDDAVARLDEADGQGGATDGDAGSDSGAEEAQTWAVDPTIGDFADFSSSFVGYRVDEEVNPIGAQTAVGRTPDVSGALTIEGTTLAEVSIDVDVSTLQSDSGIRDGQLETRGLETATFPDAAFVLTEPVELDAAPEDGARVAVDATGELTLHGVTNEVTVPIEAEIVGGVMAVTGSIDFDMRDFDIEPPTGGPILEVNPNATVEVQLFLTPG